MPNLNRYERAAIIIAAIVIGFALSVIIKTDVSVSCVVGALCMMFIYEGKK